MFKKLLSLMLVALMVLGMGTTAFAEDLSNNNMAAYNSTIYENIVDDYMLQTGLSRDQADDVFAKVTHAETVTKSIDNVEALIYGTKKGASYEDTVLFIQENYDNIVNKLSSKDKATVDAYFLAGALQYYRDYSNPEDFVQANNISSDTLYAPIEPEEVVSKNDASAVGQVEEIASQKNGSTGVYANEVAEVRIFADASGGSSSTNTSGHAWLTVKNISSSNIVVGKFNIGPNKTIAIGTWGNRTEHKGLWYSLEAYFVANNGDWT